MRIRETELRERLLGEDHDEVESTLHEHFHAVPRDAPLAFDWCPRPELTIDPDEDLGPREGLRARLMGIANGAERRVRNFKFRRRRRRKPDWPVLVCEGDSWVAHPLLCDITDQLLDKDRHHFAIRSMGAAADRLLEMEEAREYAEALREVDAAAIVISGGGNDLLLGFKSLLPLELADDPVEQVLEILFPHIHQVMCGMGRMLADIRTLEPVAPIVVHGYDYLRVGPKGEGRFLGPYFDHMGIDEQTRRDATILALVDRFNEELAAVARQVENVVYVDVRGVVPDGEWHDEIHPDKHGFARVSEIIAKALDAAIDRR